MLESQLEEVVINYLWKLARIAETKKTEYIEDRADDLAFSCINNLPESLDKRQWYVRKYYAGRQYYKNTKERYGL